MWITDRKTGQQFAKKSRRRFDNENTPHELTFSCYHGYKFLARDRARRWFVESLEDARKRWSVDLWAWVVMPEHVHVIVVPRDSLTSMGQFQGFIKERVARQAIHWLEQHSPEWLQRITVQEGSRVRRRFWQPGGAYDRNIDSVDTLQRMIEYVHLNPVRRGLVESAIDWRWSSAQWYA